MRVSQLRGLEAARAGRMDLALELLGDSVEQDPDNASARVNLATALIMNGQPDKAHAHLNKAIDSEPGLHIAHYNLASLLAEEGRDTEAMVHFRQAAALSASHRDTYFGLAHCQMRLGESVEAIESYRQVIRIDPSSKAARYWLGMAQARSRQYADAMNTLQLALSLNPGQSAVANALVRVTALTMDANEQQQRQALELANRLMQARPSVEHGLTQAMIQYAYGERADAMTRMLQVEQYRNQVGDPVMNAFVQQVGKQITDQQPLSTPWPEAAAIYQPAASLRLQLQDSRAQ
jgi:Flp pilus assembly protein TadD